MYHMFSNCNKLKSIDLSNFKANSLLHIGYMFSGCSSLTSIDFSSFNPNKLEGIENLFTNCSNLSFIDISTFPDILNYTNDDFGNISNSGQIKVNQKSSKKITEIFNSLKMNWKIIEN